MSWRRVANLECSNVFELWKGRHVARLKAVTCHAHSKVGWSKSAAVGGRVESPISTADRPNADVFSSNRWGPPGGRTLPLSCSESGHARFGLWSGTLQQL